MSNQRKLKKTYIALKAVVMVLTGLFFVQGCSNEPGIKFDNDSFYNSDGSFNPEAAKDAYITLMKYHGYPVFEGIKDKLWVSDYGTGQFAKLGLGANMFQNNEKDRYMLMDLFLLPN